jgi:branched-chain amino acid transport system substrate-binding protein
MMPMKFQKPMLLGLAAALALIVASARAEIVIAAIGPMTGPFEVFGEQVKRGTELAVADLNAKGGVLGQKIKVMFGDDRCDPKKAVAVAKDVLNQGVKFVAGHFCSGASIAASDIYNAEGILQISPASTNPALTERGFDNVYRVCGRDDQQGTIAGDYLAETFGGKKVAIVHDGRSYSKALAGAAKLQLNSRGMNEDMLASVKPGKKNYDDFVAKLQMNNIDALYYGGYHREAGLIVRRMREKGMSTSMISGDDLATQEYWKITGAAGEGTLMTYPRDPRKAPAAKSAVDTFRKAGFEPEGLTLHAYAAVQIWALAATKAGSLELDELTKALNSNVFKSVLGEIAFDGNGDIKQPAYVLYEWSGGKYAAR